MTTRRAWLACAVAGVLAFAASFLFGRIPELRPCGPSGGLGAVLAFEFARTSADVAALFGAEPCRSGLIAAQRTAALLDGLWFIPAYTTFLIMAVMASARVGRGWPPAVMLLASILAFAGFADEVEGGLLWLILATLPGSETLVAALWWPVHVKFALLAIGTAGIGGQLVGHGRRVPFRASGIGVAIMGAIALLRLVQGEVAGMMLAFTIGWVGLLAIAIAGCALGNDPRRPERDGVDA